MNYWEFKKCGREKGGARAKEFGICISESWKTMCKFGRHTFWRRGPRLSRLGVIDCIQYYSYKSQNYEKAC